MNRRRLNAALLSLPLAGWAAGAQAQDYPARPLRIVVPWSPGGGADAAARAAANALSARLRQPVVVDNKPGASGTIGAAAAAASAADGYTLFLANVDTNVVNPLVMPHLRYRPAEAFDPVGEIGRFPLVLVVRNGLRIRSVAELTQAARAAPGRLTYGTWGVGSVAHLAFALLEQTAGIDLHHIPFQGGAPTYAAVLAGHVDLALAQVSWATANAREGKVQVLGTTASRRSALAPEIPTLAEQGLAGYGAEQWLALAAPKGTPAKVVELLNQHLNAWLATAEARAQLAAAGIEASGGTAAQLGRQQQDDTASWGRLIEVKGIKASVQQ